MGHHRRGIPLPQAAGRVPIPAASVGSVPHPAAPAPRLQPPARGPGGGGVCRRLAQGAVNVARHVPHHAQVPHAQAGQHPRCRRLAHVLYGGGQKGWAAAE